MAVLLKDILNTDCYIDCKDAAQVKQMVDILKARGKKQSFTGACSDSLFIRLFSDSVVFAQPVQCVCAYPHYAVSDIGLTE